MMKSGATDILVKGLSNIKLKYSMSRKLEKPWMSALWAARDEEDGGESFAPLANICFCAAARQRASK